VQYDPMFNIVAVSGSFGSQCGVKAFARVKTCSVLWTSTDWHGIAPVYLQARLTRESRHNPTKRLSITLGLVAAQLIGQVLCSGKYGDTFRLSIVRAGVAI
jgi:hypothetical protein